MKGVPQRINSVHFGKDGCRFGQYLESTLDETTVVKDYEFVAT